MLFGYLHQLSKGFHVVHRHVSQSLPVYLQTRFPQAFGQAAVGEAAAPGGRIYPSYPESSEVALANAPVPVSVVSRFQQSLIGSPELAMASTPEAFRFPEDPRMTASNRRSSLHSGHTLYL
jgi:hypothetical protein